MEELTLGLLSSHFHLFCTAFQEKLCFFKQNFDSTSQHFLSGENICQIPWPHPTTGALNAEGSWDPNPALVQQHLGRSDVLGPSSVQIPHNSGHFLLCIAMSGCWYLHPGVNLAAHFCSCSSAVPHSWPHRLMLLSLRSLCKAQLLLLAWGEMNEKTVPRKSGLLDLISSL